MRYDEYYTDDVLKDSITHGYDFFRNENWYISAGLTKVSEYDYDEYGSWVKKVTRDSDFREAVVERVITYRE